MNRSQITLMSIGLLLTALILFLILKPQPHTAPAPAVAMEVSREAAPKPAKAAGQSTVKVFGKVVDAADGAPVPNAGLYLVLPGGGETALNTASDERGDFQFELMQAGVFRLYAASGETWSFQRRDQMHQLEVGPKVDSVGPLTLYMMPGVPVKIQLRDALSGNPVEGADLTTAKKSARTNSDGKATLTLPADQWALKVSASGFAPLRQTLDLGAGRPMELVLKLQPAGRAVGQVTDVAGSPAAGVLITAEQRKLRWETHSDDDGRFVLDSLHPGTPFDLHFEKEGFESKTLTNQSAPVDRPARYRVILKAAEIVRYELSGTVRLRGGGPLEGAEVRLEGSVGSVFTQADGTFLLADATMEPEHHYSLLVTLDGYSPRAIPVAAPTEERRIEFLISMLPARSVSGMVTDKDGSPIADVHIDAECLENSVVIQQMETVSDHRGAFQLSGLNHKVRLTLSAAGYVPQQVRLEPDRDRVSITLDRQTFIDGFVIDKRDEPVTDFTIQLLSGVNAHGLEHPSLDRARLETPVQNPEGRFTIPGPPPGVNHSWLFQAEGYLPTRLRVTSEDTELTVTLPRTSRELKALVRRSDQLQNLEVTAYVMARTRDFPWDAWHAGASDPDVVAVHPAVFTRSAAFEIENLPESLPLFLVATADGKAVSLLDSRESTHVSTDGRRAKIRIDKTGTVFLPSSNKPDEKLDLPDTAWLVLKDRFNFVTLLMKPEAVVTCRVNREQLPGAMEMMISRKDGDKYRRRLPLSEDRALFDGLQPGTYTAAVYGDDPNGVFGVLSSKEITLKEGESQTFDFGFDENHVLEGVVGVAGTPVPNALLVLKHPAGLPPRQTRTDGGGAFRFEHLADPAYELVYLGNRAHHPRDLRFLFRSHPNMREVSPGTGQSIDFAAYGSITGRAARESVSWRVFMVGKTNAGQTYYRTAAPTSQGFFNIYEVPPGNYRLSRSVSHGEPQVLVADLAVGEGEHIDLGELIPEEKGSLRLSFDDAVPQDCLFRVVVYPKGGLSTDEPLKERTFSGPDRQVMLDNLSAGPVDVWLRMIGCSTVLADETLQGVIYPDQVTGLPVRLSRETELSVRLEIDPRRRNTSGSFREFPESVSMIHVQSGQQVIFRPLEENDGRPPLSKGEAVYTTGFAWARGFPPGEWMLSVEFKALDPLYKILTLTPGERVFVNVY
ncbi:MAG: carboxypeptidase-like regulatory domain-containing protein [Acidobacteriota bacterium]|nr:carboxypeptidase-like regulatory domain-containing protein [Acidobacteriota bacterium]